MIERLDLGTIILNWNGLDDTIACLASIYAENSVPQYVVFVDNGSTDGSVEGIDRWITAHPEFEATEADQTAPLPKGFREFVLRDRNDPDIHLPLRFVTVANGRNLGFAAGNNVAIRFLMQRGVRYLMLLNNDTLLAPGALGILVAGMDRSPVCQCMVPQIRYASRPDRIWNCGAEWTWFGTPRYYYAEASIDDLEGKPPFELEMVSGCAVIIRRSWLETHGILTERFFFGEEDIDLSWRMRATGRGSMYCWPQAVIYHKVGASLVKRADVGLLPKVYVHYLNRMIFLRGAWGRGYRWYARRIVVNTYFAWKLVARMGFAPREAVRIVRDFARDSLEREGVDAEFFSYLMNGKFRGVT